MAVTILPSSDAGTVVCPSSFEPQAVMVPPVPEAGTALGAAEAEPPTPTMSRTVVTTETARALAAPRRDHGVR